MFNQEDRRYPAATSPNHGRQLQLDLSCVGQSASRRSRYAVLLGVLLLGLSLVSATTIFARHNQRGAALFSAIPSSKIDPAVSEALGQANDGRHLRVIVHMRAAMEDPFSDLPQQTDERHVTVVQRLQQSAAQAQAGILAALQQGQDAGGVSSYRSLWIINAIQVAATQETINALAARSDVARISADVALRLLSPMTPTISPANPDLPWHLHRTRVQHVWAGLGISGTGSTIAVMDTGADWQHPALVGSYRGLADATSPDHQIAWFDAVEGLPEPVDPHGHGTHVIGTASGRLGIGAAPGSNWMAVRILRPDGTGFIGDIHAGFQWLLAPNGDPALAPDVVNGSWSTRPDFVAFTPDIQALHAAGIITVFSAGNSGPESGTIQAPANYPGVVAVGATDDIDEVAWFSSRGPSLLTSEVKPAIVAPGVQILSALPDGAFGYYNGTSMAAPHIAGIYALLLSADPTLDAVSATAILTSTAHPVGSERPSSDAGWGRADAYDALAGIVSAGHLAGVVSGDGFPIPGATITVTTPNSVQLPLEPADDGSFQAHLISGTYSIAVAAYGYVTHADPAVVVRTDAPTEYIVDLVRLPYGRAEGQLLDMTTGLPLSGTVRFAGAPVEATVAADGHYAIELPVGAYELVAWVRGHLLGRQAITITAGATTRHDLQLQSGPDVLLVDSGKWYGGSQIQAYESALQENDFSYELLTIRDLYRDSPTYERLAQYEAVVWSSPGDSPGASGSASALSAYLDSGGNVLIGGQNAAALDYGQLTPQRWWHQQLRATYLGKAEAPFTLIGEPGSVFDGLDLTLLESDNAGEPVHPDASEPAPNSLTSVGLRYADGNAASLLAGQCDPYRIAYLGFGLENVSGPEMRETLISAAFDYFAQPETEYGLKLGQEYINALVPPGSTRSYPVRLLNLSEIHTDTFRLSIGDSNWPAQVLSDTVVLGPCQWATTALEVNVPAELPLDAAEQFQLVVESALRPGYRQTMTIHLKSAGRVLLVDDDRWYDQSATFQAAMTGAGVPFDFWDNGGNDGKAMSPPQDLLDAYDFVVWYTAYDWFRPVTAAESQSLASYLAQGGRLFLTSQDYLYHHLRDPLTRDYLGVLHYAESVTPTIAYGAGIQGSFADIGGPQVLSFGQYQNHGDGVVPASGALVSLWHDAGYPAGLAAAGSDWRTIFWGIPFETLPTSTHARAMNRILGWLSDLGESAFVVDHRSSMPGAAQAYTLTLRYSAAAPGTWVAITNTLPASLALNIDSLGGGAHYDGARRQITWSGPMSPGQEHQITYLATPAIYLTPGQHIENRVQIYYADHDLSFERTASTWIAAPDPTRSHMTLSPPWVRPGENVTVQVTLINDGMASPFSSRLPFPAEVKPLTTTLAYNGGQVGWSGQLLTWSGWLEPGMTITASVIVTTALGTAQDWLPLTAIVDDGLTYPVIASSMLELRPYSSHLPFIPRFARP